VFWQLTTTSTGSEQRRRLQFESLNVWGVDQDGKTFGRLNENLAVYEWGGTSPITSLRAFPLDFHPDKAEVKKRLIQRGRLFEQYFGYHYMHYTKTALTYGKSLTIPPPS
jgi:hypothetical protein